MWYFTFPSITTNYTKDNVFPSLDGFETTGTFYQKRAMLEFVFIRHLIKNESQLPLEIILEEAKISTRNEKNLNFLLQSINYNGIINLHHQDLHDKMITSTTHLDVIFSCNPFWESYWARLFCEDKHSSFDTLDSSQKDKIIGELTEKINQMIKLKT